MAVGRVTLRYWPSRYTKPAETSIPIEMVQLDSPRFEPIADAMSAPMPTASPNARKASIPAPREMIMSSTSLQGEGMDLHENM